MIRYSLCCLILMSSPLLSAESMVSCDFNKQNNGQQTSGPAMVADVADAMTPIPLNAVQITDSRISRKVMVEGVYARRTPAATLEVMTRVVNCTDYAQNLQLRSSFMDEQQFPVENTSAWQRVILPARATGVYRETSIGTYNVSHFLIEMKEGD